MTLLKSLRDKALDERFDGLFAIERELRALLDRKLAPLGITYAQLALLRLISRLNAPDPDGQVSGVRATDIADYYGFAMRTVTVALNRVVASGLVERGRSPTDRRAVNLSLTGKGADVLAKAAPCVEKARNVFNGLPASHWNRLWTTIPFLLIEIQKENRRDELRARHGS